MNSTGLRTGGILLHPTSLPGPHGIGALGRTALEFLDFLHAAEQQIWQVLPLGPTGDGDSPYNALSAFAGNPLLIDLEQLVQAGDLKAEECPQASFSAERVDFSRVRQAKNACLELAADRFFARPGHDPRRVAYADFCTAQKDWLDDYALFIALKEKYHQSSWTEWPEAARLRHSDHLAAIQREAAGTIRRERYQQFVFSAQWAELRKHAADLGIRLFGDIPIFVALDSADVWAHQELFQLDRQGRPVAMAGVPPDYFSKTGQLWGNPLYQWERHAADGFAWWLRRFHHHLQMFDLVRVDHFRGFEACWTVPAGAPTAESGHWEPVPGHALFARLQEEFPNPPIVAEDLGTITPEVEALRDAFDLPGMKILQFAFDSGPDNPYLPHNHRRRSVVYTGTHDNDTTVGWWQSLPAHAKQNVAFYLDKAEPEIPWDLIRLAMSSVADCCIIPVQDLLALGNEARFNLPGSASGNWTWRLAPDRLDLGLAVRLAALTRAFNRSRSA